MKPAWNFPPHLGATIFNPLGGESLSEQEDDWQPGESLVRECIQNSLDAKIADCIEVRFAVHLSGSMNLEQVNHWFGDLWPHLRSKDCKLSHISDRPTRGGYLVIEDFGTSGLEGDFRQTGLSDDVNRFFAFCRAEGLSGNSANGNKGGSWGQGKSVFNRCSDINSFLCLTVQNDTRKSALIGRSVIWHHRTDDGEYQAFGLFGERESEESPLTLPIHNQDFIDRFRSEFDIRRKTEPGLSIVVPYADPNISAQTIVQIVLREYFFAISAGVLKVVVEGALAGNKGSVVIDQSTIKELSRKFQRPEEQKVSELAINAINLNSVTSVRLNSSPPQQSPRWDKDLFPTESDSWKQAQSCFAQGNPVAVQVPMLVYPHSQRPESAEFVVLLQKDVNNKGFRPRFVRGWTIVPNARRSAGSTIKMFSFVRIQDDPLAVMLRAAEPPAHTSWTTQSTNIRGRYDHAEDAISFVIRAPERIAEALAETNEKIDRLSLSQFFPMSAGAGPTVEHQPPRSDSTVTTKRPKPIIDAESWASIQRQGSGFVVLPSEGSESSPREFTIETAYATGRGDPLGKYHPDDYQLECFEQAIAEASEGFTKIRCEGNIIHVIRNDSDNWRIVVDCGCFDHNRDLYVKPTADTSNSIGTTEAEQ